MRANGTGECNENVFLALHKWAEGRGQDENFTTEVFGLLLKRLSRTEPDSFMKLLGALTGGSLRPTDASCDGLAVIVQRRVGGNQPDIRIVGREVRIVIEIKVRQPVDWCQVRRYRDELDCGGCSRSCLVLLTRDFVVQMGHAEASKVQSYVRWFQVGELIREERMRISDAVGMYLAEQFVEFLRARRITMEKAGSDLIRGVSSLESLITMLEEAVTSAGWQPKPRYLEEGCSGVWFGPQGGPCPDGKCWCGLFHHGEGLLGELVFQVYEWRGAVPEGWQWTKEGKKPQDVLRYRMNLVECGFFEKDAQAQWDQVKRFVSDRLRNLRDLGDPASGGFGQP